MMREVQQELFAKNDGVDAMPTNRLTALLANPSVELCIHDNRRTMVSLKRHAGGRIQLRLHRHFLQAPDAVLQDLARYIHTGRRPCWQSVADYAARIPACTPACIQVKTAPVGGTYNLTSLYEDLNAHFFSGELRCYITWGRRAARAGRQRSICYGSYDHSQRLIRINPLLDSPKVEADFVRYIIYHEMLHAALPVQRKNGRNDIHTAVFRVREKRFPDWFRMQQLSKIYLHELS